MAVLYKREIFNDLYDKYSKEFLEEYCKARRIHQSHDLSLHIARIAVLDSIIYAMHRENKKRFILFNVHKTLKGDQSLHLKAVEKYTLA
jgi:hypothetical protein